MPKSVETTSSVSLVKIVLFGSEGGFSKPVLMKLLAHGVSVSAVVMPGVATTKKTDEPFPITIQPATNINSLAGLATAHAVQVLRTQNIHDPQLLRQLSALAADIMLVACFPLKIPKSIWQLPRLASWNLHPSMLPRYRGPTPLFWQLHHQERNTGISLHELTDQLDAGNIVAQQAHSLPTCTDAAKLNEWVAEMGVDLFLEAIQQCLREGLSPRIQDEAAASYFPRPEVNE